MSDPIEIPITDLRDAWRGLASNGTPPASLIAGRVLPAWSVGLDGWLDRLSNVYLQDYCLRNAHFKLAIAPYGGGKTHFLLSLGARAEAENWATCYLQCKANVSLSDWFGLYEHVAKSIHLPNSDATGIRSLFKAALEQMAKRAQKAPDPEFALDEILSALEEESWPHDSFARVATALLNHLRDQRMNPTLGDAALRWLQGQPDTLSAAERQSLHLQTIRAGNRMEHGRTLFYSLVKFIPRAGVNGLVILFDEMDTILSTGGKALERILTSMRVMLDAPDNRMDRVPLFGVFAAVPDIAEKITIYQALKSRFEVFIPFHQGNDNAAQLDLSELGSQKEILREIGEKLLQMGLQANGWKMDVPLQRRNLQRLADVTATRRLEVNARRLFVKAWCSLLEEQARAGESEKSEAELIQHIDGVYAGFRKAEESNKEDDLG